MTSIRHRAVWMGRTISGALACVGLLMTGTSVAQDAQEPLFTVMNPTGIAPAIELKAMSPRPESLDGKTIFLVDVTFNGGDLFLQQMELWLNEHHPEIKTDFRRKRGAYSADDPELWREIQAADGVMVMAIGH